MNKLATVAILAALPLLAGCAPAPHDQSLSESCKVWKTLSKGPSVMTPETSKTIHDDLIAAEPRMHAAVASQVLVYAKYDHLQMNSDQRDEVLAAASRLYDLCNS